MIKTIATTIISTLLFFSSNAQNHEYHDPTTIQELNVSKTLSSMYRNLFTSTSACFTTEKTPQEIILENFTPSIHITQQLPQDKEVLQKMRPLFFERRDQGFFESINNTLRGRDPDNGIRKNVYAKSIKEYGGHEFMVLTEDQYRISTLSFKRENAPINLLYVVGYFRGNTPSKEWAAPFSQVFPKFNTYSFDWRGYCDSDGQPKEFDLNAYKDIQAVIDHIRKENDKPIVAIGFCLGAALLLKCALEAQKAGNNMPDALVLNSLPSRVENMKKRVADIAPNIVLRKIFSYRFAQDYILDHMAGDLFKLAPVEMIKELKLPLYFENYMYDPVVPLAEAVENYQAAQGERMTLFSEVGRHVRIHSKAPWQYREAMYEFLRRAKLL